MKYILITGSDGFIGKNLKIALRRKSDVVLLEYRSTSSEEELETALSKVDIIYHLAGVNRTTNNEDFINVNWKLTQKICDYLSELDKKPIIIFTSSAQATLDNPYGQSKLMAEKVLKKFSSKFNSSLFIYRLPGVFGKWCRPDYNSVVATFCSNIARSMPITISDSEKEIKLVYIDDVVKAFLNVLELKNLHYKKEYFTIKPIHTISLESLSKLIYSFRDSRINNKLPDINSHFKHALYATYISYLPTDSFSYSLTKHEDPRGELSELLKSPEMGQIFVSRTRPGYKRGEHYHDTKVEKFVVLDGDAQIQFRHVLKNDIIDYVVSGHQFRVVDIPPGYTHSIKNIGETDLIVLFWADEVFNPNQPDTISLEV